MTAEAGAGSRGPGVWIPPPMLWALAFMAGWLLHRSRPLPLLPPGTRSAAVVLGWIGIAAGLAWNYWAIASFVRARTSIVPVRPASSLVLSGPYRYSRNPMYIGLTGAYLGGVVLTNMAWPLFTLPIALLLVLILVIRPEERYLRARFGEDYAAYCTRVRRWI